MTRAPRTWSAVAVLGAGVWVLAAAALLPACLDGSSAGDDTDTAGALTGEIETLVYDYEDGRSERRHVFNLDDRDAQLTLLFDREPELTTSKLRIWGVPEGDAFRVIRYQTVAPPPSTIAQRASALVGAPSRTRRAAFVLVDLGGGVNITNAAAQAAVFGNNFANVYDQASFGTLKFTGDVIGPLPFTMAACDTNGLTRMLKPMITTTYDHYMWYLGQRTAACAWGGIGAEGNTTTPRGDSWYNAGTSCVVLVQEVGHNLGMMHSSTITCAGASFANDPTAAGCTASEYGNRFTPMGSGCGHFNAHDKWYQRYFGGCNAIKARSSGTFNLLPIELACGGIQAIQVPMPVTTRTFKPEQGNNPVPLLFYYLEYRTATGIDANLRGGTLPTVFVHAGDEIRPANRTSVWSWLLDMNTTTTGFQGLTVGQTFTDPAGGVSITLTAADATKATVNVVIPGGTGDPLCMDGTTTLAAPGPADCGAGSGTVGTGTGGTAGGAGGAGGRGGAGGTAGTGGSGIVTGSGGTTGTGGAGTATGAGGATTATGLGGSPATGAGGGPSGPGASSLDPATGGCACSMDAGARGGGTTLLLAAAGLTIVLGMRRRRKNQDRA